MSAHGHLSDNNNENNLAPFMSPDGQQEEAAMAQAVSEMNFENGDKNSTVGQEQAVLLQTLDQWVGILLVGAQGDNSASELIEASAKAVEFVKLTESGASLMTESATALSRVLEAIMLHLRSNTFDVRCNSTMAVRRFLSVEADPPIQQVIDQGGALALVDTIRNFSGIIDDSKVEELVYEACWALTNIASGTTDHVHQLLRTGVVSEMVSLLACSSSRVAEQAVWALGNIAGDSAEGRDIVLATVGNHGNGIEHLNDLLARTGSLSMMRVVVWTISNLIRYKPPPPLETCRSFLPTLARLIYSVDEEVLADTCWTLSYITEISDDAIQEVVEAGVCRRIIELLMHNSVRVQVPALRTVGSICTGNELQTQVVINCGALPSLNTICLALADKEWRKKLCGRSPILQLGPKHRSRP